jgi:hypothetical protein
MIVTSVDMKRTTPTTTDWNISVALASNLVFFDWFGGGCRKMCQFVMRSPPLTEPEGNLHEPPCTTHCHLCQCERLPSMSQNCQFVVHKCRPMRRQVAPLVIDLNFHLENIHWIPQSGITNMSASPVVVRLVRVFPSSAIRLLSNHAFTGN